MPPCTNVFYLHEFKLPKMPTFSTVRCAYKNKIKLEIGVEAESITQHKHKYESDFSNINTGNLISVVHAAGIACFDTHVCGFNAN